MFGVGQRNKVMKNKYLQKYPAAMGRLIGSLLFIVCLAASLLQTAAAAVKDNVPLGRQAVAVVDGQYPASYFPNTELLGADEMRITALGTGMPNQTRAAVSISYLVELGNGDRIPV